MNKQLFGRIVTMTEAFREFCEKRTSWCLIGLSVLYLLITCSIASQRMLWNDELFTLYISRLTNLSDILAVLATGADQNPPSFYLLTHGFLWLPGRTELVVRLPEILAFLLMGLCLFRFVSRRLPPLYGFAAMLFPLVTIAYEYAYEARPYGLVLGFSSLALLCWQGAAEGSRRVWWLIGLAVATAAAISSHYYGVFLLVPLGLGELVRSVTRRRIDYPIWIALGCSMLPLLLFLPWLQQARTYSRHFWALPDWKNIPGFYYFLLTPAIGPIVATLIASSLWPTDKPSREHPSLPIEPLVPWHEIAAALGFVSIPAVAVVTAKLITGAFIYRYAISAVIGFSLLFAFAAHRLQIGRAVIGSCFVLFACVWFIGFGAIQYNQHALTTAGWSKTYEFLRAGGGPELPIVAADLHTFMTLAHYGPGDLSSRAVYLADPRASIRYLGHDTVDRGILDLRPWFPVCVEEYAPYVASHEQFLIYTRIRGIRSWLGYFWGEPWDLNWLLYELPTAPLSIELKGRDHDDVLFLASSTGRESTAKAGVEKATTATSMAVAPATSYLSGTPCPR